MKKISRYLLITILLILTACSERELSFNRTFPNTVLLDELREKRQLEIEEEIKNAPNDIRETRPLPRSFLIYEPRSDTSKYAHASQYCWEYNYLDCDERMKPKHPYDSSEIKLDTLAFNPNTILEIYSEQGRGATLPYPSKVEVYIYDQEKNLQLVHTVDDLTEHNMFKYKLPSELGVYFYQFKAYYKGEIQGISYHPFMFIIDWIETDDESEQEYGL